MSKAQTSIPENSIEARFLLQQEHSSPFTLDLDLSLPGAGVTAIFGASGSGKTTFLRCIAGLEDPSEARLIINGECWHNQDLKLPTHQRALGYVFQEASLFPHLSVEGNLNYAVKRATGKVSLAERENITALLGIENLMKRHPEQLSGGEKQRVAIARALMTKPRMLLMDEPLASLDVARKQEILPFLEQLKASLDIPILYVSHDLSEVTRLADHVVILDQGRLVTQGALTKVFSQAGITFLPDDEQGVVIEAQVIEKDSEWQLSKVAFNGGALWVRDSGEKLDEKVRLRILAKDVSITLSANDESSILNRLNAEIVNIVPDLDQAMVLVEMKIGQDNLVSRMTKRSAAHLNLKSKQMVWAQIKSVALAR